jgi:hypothetical protein
MHDCIAGDQQSIAFPHLRVELAKRLTLRMPQQTMLCTLWVRALVPDGTVVAANYIQFFVDAGSPARQRSNLRTVLRLDAYSWNRSEWNHRTSTREQALNAGAAYGGTRGFFEYKFPVSPEQLRKCSRLTVLCEASTLGDGAPQTDRYVQPSMLRLLLNGVPIYRAPLPGHPHDARGALSYLRGGRGAYGYLCHATIESELLGQVVRNLRGNHLRLRFLVPRDEQSQRGLTIYGYNAGRYPIGPTVIMD